MNAETMNRVLLQGGTVIDPQKASTRGPTCLWSRTCREGRSWHPVGGGTEVLDCRGKHIAPGFADMHCHLREPGREDEETIATAPRRRWPAGSRASADAEHRAGHRYRGAGPVRNPPADEAVLPAYTQSVAAPKAGKGRNWRNRLDG